MCTPCDKHNADCNITEHVMYSYETVSKLQDRIHALERREQQSAQNNATNDPESLPTMQRAVQSPQYADSSLPSLMRTGEEQGNAIVGTIAEEVGNLTLGTMHNMSHKYGIYLSS